MRLQRLTGLEQEKIVGEYEDVVKLIADLIDILSKPARISDIIAEELEAIKLEFSTNAKDGRRSRLS